MKKTLLLILTVCFFCAIKAQDKNIIRVVVLGSSTAVGTGASDPEKAWVNQYRDYLTSYNPDNEVINLAVGGYTTYHIMPTGYETPDGSPDPDRNHNITKAISYAPDVIIINLPSNDAAENIEVEEQLANYQIILSEAKRYDIPVFISTTQPRRLRERQIQIQKDMRDSTLSIFGDFAIDFWTDVATENGVIKQEYNSGDGTHLNNTGHTILFKKVKEKPITAYSRVFNENDTILIDFGTKTSDIPWNNMTKAMKDTIYSLRNLKNQKMGIAAWVHDAFTGVSTTGTESPENSLKIPASASSDGFFGNGNAHNGITEPTGGITLSGLNPHLKYSFTIFASQNNVSDERETQYIVTSLRADTLILKTSNNTSQTVKFENLSPSANGIIKITASPGPGNTSSELFYYLGAIVIDYKAKSNTNAIELQKQLNANNLIQRVYPNPTNNRFSINCNAPHEGKLKIQILDMAGRVITTIYKPKCNGGEHTFKCNPNTSMDRGMYIIKATFSSKQEVIHSSEKLIIN